MPLYRYECRACGREREELHGLDELAPRSRCCDADQRRLMPRRVRGVVLAPGQAQAARAREEVEAAKLTSMAPSRRETSAVDIPEPSWSGPPTSRADSDARWLDTVEAMASWQTRSLTADGVDYGKAKRRAEKHQQQVAAEAVASDAGA